MRDVFSESKRSEVMSKIRWRGNKITELAMIKLFRLYHISGWRRHYSISLKIPRLRDDSMKANIAA